MVFNSNRLFQIIYDCETENVHHRKSFWWNLFLKVLRNNFLPNMWFAIKGKMEWDMYKLLMPVSDTECNALTEIHICMKFEIYW